MKTLYIEGRLYLSSYGDADDLLFVEDLEEPLAEFLECIYDKEVTVRYWVTDKQATKEEAQESFIKTLIGFADGEFGARYSDITGYLWTDEELNVGGHNLIDELKTFTGKWLFLEIEYEDILE